MDKKIQIEDGEVFNTRQTEFEAIDRKTGKIYPVVSLGVYGMIRKHTLLDIYSEDAEDGEAPLKEVYDKDVVIIKKRGAIDRSEDFLVELGKTVLKIDWKRIEEELDTKQEHQDKSLSTLGKYWKDGQVFSAYHNIYHQYNKEYDWLKFIGDRKENSINILEHIEMLEKEITKYKLLVNSTRKNQKK